MLVAELRKAVRRPLTKRERKRRAKMIRKRGTASLTESAGDGLTADQQAVLNRGAVSGPTRVVRLWDEHLHRWERWVRRSRLLRAADSQHVDLNETFRMEAIDLWRWELSICGMDAHGAGVWEWWICLHWINRLEVINATRRTGYMRRYRRVNGL